MQLATTTITVNTILSAGTALALLAIVFKGGKLVGAIGTLTESVKDLWAQKQDKAVCEVQHKDGG